MRRSGLILAIVAVMLALASLALWMLQSGSSEAELDSMHNCPLSHRWSIAVWGDQSGTAAADALATCGAGAVDAAYSIDPQTQEWSRWFAANPALSNMPPLNDWQGVLALGSETGSAATATATPSPTATATPTATPTPPVAAPQLRVETVAEDDELRNEGIMVLCPTLPPAGAGAADPDTCNDNGNDIWEDLHASYKLAIAYNGVPVDANFACMVVQKTAESPSQPQWPPEVVVTDVSDVSPNFACKSRFVAPGVGVLDVYYLGPKTADFVGSYELVVQAYTKIGSSTVWGTEVQDLCMLGWPFNDAGANKTFSVNASTEAGLRHLKRAPQPLDGFASCDDAALYQRQWLNLTIP